MRTTFVWLAAQENKPEEEEEEKEKEEEEVVVVVEEEEAEEGWEWERMRWRWCEDIRLASVDKCIHGTSCAVRSQVMVSM